MHIAAINSSVVYGRSALMFHKMPFINKHGKNDGTLQPKPTFCKSSATPASDKTAAAAWMSLMDYPRASKHGFKKASRQSRVHVSKQASKQVGKQAGKR